MTDTRSISLPSVSDLVAAFAADAGKASEEWVRDYRSADKGTKTRMRALRTNAFKEAFRNKSYDAAAALDSVESDMSVSTDKPAINPNEEIGTLVANYLEAVIRLLSGEAILSGNFDTSVELTETDASVLRDIADGLDLPDFKPETVESLITVRIGKKARENDIAGLVVEAFENVPSGTFMKVSDIRTRIGTLHPELDVSGGWDGRVSAALFTNNDAKGVEGVISVGGPNKVNREEWLNHGKNGGIKA